MSSDSVYSSLSVVIQLLGAISVGLARLNQHSKGHLWYQRLVMASLLIVGSFALVSLYSGHSTWLPCGVTLSLMTVGATLDVGGPRGATGF